MFLKLNYNIILFFLIVSILRLHAFDFELTVLIQANQRECFHQVLEAGRTIEVEYEVLNGGDFDINFWFYSPSNRVLQSDFKKRDGHQVLKLEETGEYRFCLDNSISRFHQKQVYFSLRPVNEHGQSAFEHTTESWMKTMDVDQLGDLQTKIQDIRDTFQRIYDHMETAQHYQSNFRNNEGQDRVILEKNYERINFWSIINLTLMIAVTIIQVLTIRSLFESKSAYGKLLRGRK
ncbi:hypothetical protein I4U23_018937 [Adineta vaga]|nr:hypothetical protein I4U23_018937 [Adineta vaga]